ncbi:U2 snRNP complex subunit [Mucor velutinosus]|uniref:U2 snRNP complex subunit n=1 Tax=Mucor velutinosus TaxID=708070 RepID=A0AAN7DPN6_9FUNG|nr:U2 snRNP complex subunit [Mucor velutinosus]
MELPTNTAAPKPPKRQVTLGPTSPIQDWEVERATILADRKESCEKAERLEKKLELDRQTYEKNTASLLRENKLKETFLEKRIKDVQEQLMEELVLVQRTLDEERSSFQEQLRSLKSQHEAAFEAEEKKYQRRLTSLQERLNAKDKEYAEIFEKEQHSSTAESDVEKEKIIESLNIQIAKNQEEMAKLRESNPESEIENDDDDDDGTPEKQAETSTSSSKEYQQLESLYKSLQEKFEATELVLKDCKQENEDHLRKIDELKTSLSAAQQQRKRIDQVVSSQNDHIKELTEKFMSEVRQTEMTNQAQFQNLQSEHTELMRELREQHETEKEVWQIEQTTLIDEMRRELNFEKEEALRELGREWKEKSEDLHASMSKDAMEIQAHWESKLQEAKSGSLLKVSRLQGEIAVVKDRLGREITRRKQNQALLEEAINKNKLLDESLRKYQSKCHDLLNRRTTTEKEIQILKCQHRTSYKLALDLLTITSPNKTIDSRARLPDILQTAVRDATLMRFHAETEADTQGSAFAVNGIPTYGF